MSAFPSTRHSIIERLRSAEPAPRREAFGDLVEAYWRPVYKYLRIKWRLSAEEAEDVTQSFFAQAFEKDWFARYDVAQARFRTFVRVCVDRRVMNEQQAAGRAMRGGDLQRLALDFSDAEHELAAHGAVSLPDADDLFQREFVRALFGRAIAAVRTDCEARGRLRHWQLFERYDLSPGADVSYAALAREFGLSEGQVTGYLAQMRASFRTHALAALEGLCASRDEFRREARELLGVDVE